MKNNQLVKISAILLLVTSFLPSAKASPVLSFSNKEALKFQKTLKEGETEIIEFAEPVSLAHYGSSDKSMDNIELEKLEASAAGYKKFLIKAKRAGSTELTFLAGKELIKVKVFVQNNYDALEDELNKLFGMKEATEEERIKVISTNQNANIDSSPKTHIYLKGKVANAKNAMLAVAFAANVLGDKGVKIFSNPGGQLRQKNLEQPENDTSNNSSQNQESSFAEFYENTNKLIDSNNLYRDLILASEEEKVISYIQIKEPKRYAIKVRFLEMDARYVDEFLSSLSATSTASDLAGSFGTATLASPSLGSGTGGFSGSSILQQIGVKGVTELSSQIVGGSLVSGAVKILDKAFLNVNLNDLLREGALRIVNEFSLVTHSGEMVSLGKGTRFPIPKQNNGIGNTSITVEYIPIGFKGELKVTSLDNDLIDVQLASRLSSAQASAASISGMSIPIFSEEYVNSGALLKNGQEVVLNAFMTEAETIAKSTSPLGRILPILGSSKNKQKSKNLLFIALEATEIDLSNKSEQEFNLPHLDLAKNRNIFTDVSGSMRTNLPFDIAKLNGNSSNQLSKDPLQLDEGDL